MLKRRPYRALYLDCKAGDTWYECYHPDHPMTRTENRQHRAKVLQFVSEECGLLTGSENGHDTFMPYVHHFQRMMSPFRYRLPDSEHGIPIIWRPEKKLPEHMTRYLTGHYYRLPLWELVYHDCVVFQWAWGDFSNKALALWDRRDLFNVLYGTLPSYMFKPHVWKRLRDRFVQSYKTATPVARATGYAEMLSHRWLTPDHAVQETRFSNGVTVTVNLGDTSYTIQDGTLLKPLSHRVIGLPQEE